MRANVSANNSFKEIKRGAIISYLTLAVNILSGLLYTPWLIEKIGQSDYGLYTLATSFISLFLFDFGISAAVSKFATQYIANGQQKEVDRFVSTAYKLYILIDTIVFAILIAGYFLINNIYAGLTPAEIEKFKIVYIIVGIYSIFSFPFVTLSGVLNAYEKFTITKLCELFQKLGTVLIMIAMLLLGGGLYELVLVNAGVGIVVCIIRFIAVKKTTPVSIGMKKADNACVKQIFGFSIFSTISSLAQRFIFNFMPTILGIVASSAAISIFGIASTLEGYTYLFSSAINGMFFPKISRIVNKNGNESSLLDLMVKVGRLQFTIVALIFAGFLCVGKDFILLWVGEEYLIAYYGTLAMIFPSLLRVPQQIAQTSMLATDNIKTQAGIYCIGAVLNVIIAFPLTMHIGVFGAMLSICIANIVRFVIMNVAYYKKLKLNVFAFAKRCYLSMLPPLVISIVAGIGIDHLIGETTWVNLILRSAIIVIVYAASAWFVSFNSFEKGLVFDLLKIKRRG